jgi:type IV secretory pathway VirD2 relaxase
MSRATAPSATICDLHAYTREVMERAETMLGRGPLDWVAVDHWDTANPHTHIVLRGRLANGRPLGLPRDFVRHQFREIARDVASERIGPRCPDEERLAPDREVRRHARTRLDRYISERLDLNRDVRLSDLSRGVSDPELARRVRSRADELERLGLAERSGRGQLRFARDWLERLDGMEMHLDVRRRLVRERQYERDLDRAGDKLSRETGKPFQKARDLDRTWRVRDMRTIGGKQHLALERWDAVTLAPTPRGIDISPGQKLQLGADKTIRVARGLGLDR